MKTNKGKLFAAAVFYSLFAFSCQKSNEVSPDDQSAVKLQTNENEYRKLVNARTSYDDTPFEITKISKESDVLKIVVENGCTPTDFKITWDGRIMMSYPAQANIVVSHNGNMDCTTPKAQTLELDIIEFFGEPDLTINVANGSKVADTSIDSDGVITNKP